MKVNEVVQRTKIIAYALIASQVFFAGIVGFASKNGMLQTLMDSSVTFLFSYLVPLSVIGVIPLVFFLYKNKSKQAKLFTSDAEKLGAFQSIKIIQFALIEFISFLCIIAFAFTNQQQYIYLFLISIVFFFVILPSERAVKEDFEVSET